MADSDDYDSDTDNSDLWLNAFDYIEVGDRKLPTWLIFALLAVSFVGTLACLLYWEKLVALFGG